MLGIKVLHGTRPCRSFDHAGLEPLGKRSKAMGYIVFYFKGSLQALAPCIWVITMVHRLLQRCGAKHRRLILSKTKMAFGYVLRVSISKVDMQVVA